MEPKRGLQALLGTIQAWLERAGDDEVLTLYRLVRAEVIRRKLRHNSIPPEDSDQLADPPTPPKKNS